MILMFTQRFFSFHNNLQSHEIHRLETYTQYLVSLQVFNPEGPGPATTVLVMTDEGGECFFLFSFYFGLDENKSYLDFDYRAVEFYLEHLIWNPLSKFYLKLFWKG